MAEVVLVTGRSLNQGIGLELGKTSREYFDAVSYVEVNPGDISEFGLREGVPAFLTTEHGGAVLSWRPSEGLPHGMVFVPYGIWANQVLGWDTRCTGTPQYKGVKARISSAEGRRVSTLTELVAGLREGKP